MMKDLRQAILVAIVAIAAALFIWAAALVTKADARYKPEYAQNSPEIQAWFKAQHNESGLSCCDTSDGHRFDGNYWFNVDGSITVSEDGKEYHIEKSKVLTGHNPTGSAIWFYNDYGSGRVTFCFSPGSLS